MSKNYVTGYPRIGEKRELKFALENYWSGKSDLAALETTARELRSRHWQAQRCAGIDTISCNDFSYYDTMLDTCIMLGAIPQRFRDIADPTTRYFAMARGDNIRTAMEMTKWFNTNYHYIVPEFSKNDTFAPNTEKLVSEYCEARSEGIVPKINLIGPLTFLGLGKSVDAASDRFSHFDAVLSCYESILKSVGELDDIVTVQIDEPILVTGPDPKILSLLKIAYDRLAGAVKGIDIIVATYFEHACEAVDVLAFTPVKGIALDFVYGPRNIKTLDTIAKSGKLLVAGVIDGRNVWRSDLDAVQEKLAAIAQHVPQNRIVVATSCALLHVPYSLEIESKLDPEIKQWLAFAKEKLAELNLAAKQFFGDPLDPDEKTWLQQSRGILDARQHSARIHDAAVQTRTAKRSDATRALPYEKTYRIAT